MHNVGGRRQHEGTSIYHLDRSRSDAAFLNAQSRDERIAALEPQLREAKSSVAALQKTIETLGTELEALRQSQPSSSMMLAQERVNKPEAQDAAQE